MKFKILAFTLFSTLITISSSNTYASTINSSNNNLEIKIDSNNKNYHSAQITFEIDNNIKNFETTYNGLDVFYKNTLTTSSDSKIKEVTTLIDNNKSIDGLNISYNIPKDKIKSPIKIKYLYNDNGKIKSEETTLKIINNTGNNSPSQVSTNNGYNTNNAYNDDKNHSPSLNNNTQNYTHYSDINNHWAKPFITDLGSKGIIKGYPDGTFKPNNKIIRGDFFLLINNIIDDNNNVLNNTSFKDLNETYYTNAIKNLSNLNIISGYSDNTIKPNNLITREEVAVVIDRLLSLYNKDTNINKTINFLDEKDISTWAKTSINKLTNMGIMSGYTDNSIKPKQDITRGEVAKLLHTVLNLK